MMPTPFTTSLQSNGSSLYITIKLPTHLECALCAWALVKQRYHQCRCSLCHHYIIVLCADRP